VDDSFRVGAWLVQPNLNTVSSNGTKVRIEPKVMEVLVCLASRPGEAVAKETILKTVWPGTFVSDDVLTRSVSELRRVFVDDAREPQYIETIPKRGYCLIAAVERLNGSGQPPKPSAPVDYGVNEFRRRRSDLLRTAAISIACILALGLVLRFLVVVANVSWRHPPKSEKIMLAVLPFQNLTGDPNKEYLADGLTEEMISQLGRLNPEQLGVIARTSVMGYKHKNVRLDQIGRDLSVQYVLENSLRESGDHLRLTAQLIQVRDQTHLWSQDYDYPPKDILNVEDQVAKSVAHEIRVRLTSKEQAELAQSHPVNPKAFDAYLQGYYFFHGSTDKDTDMAAKYFERATQLDPSYALAWAWLSRARNWQANEGLIPMEEGRRLSREAVEQALSLNPNLADAHAQMGRIKQQADYDWAGANASFQRAVALEPANPENLGFAAWSASILGHFDEAVQLNRRAVDLDPLNAGSWENLATTEFMMGQLDQSAADSKKALELNPDAGSGAETLSLIYLLQGRPQDGLRDIERVPYGPSRACLYSLTYYALGRKKESDAALSELMIKYSASNAYEIALVYAFRNQADKSFEWLDRAYAQRDSSMMYTKVEPLLNSLHNDPRFAALLKKLNLPI
jgi:TolB-like protein/DNA-binding winged helix-turn-helix (wHTH) protein